jgi:hypothetical protein
MATAINLTGNRFGRLTVINRDLGNTKHGASWLCMCDCGTERVTTSKLLRAGKTQSCGCLQRELVRKRATTHQLGGTPEHRSWAAMHTRCRNKNRPQWKDWGGRGITVCTEWSRFEQFLLDMGPRPSLKHTLDRIDVNSNYFKENCRWADRVTQNNNQRRHIQGG